MSKIILEIKNISKQFGGTQALSNVSLNIKRGNILALLGSNGAGKSTLIKILAGVYPKDSGTIFYKGKEIESVKSLTNEDEHVISFIHQDLGLIDWMTVSENIGLSMGFIKKAGFFIDWKAMNLRAKAALDVLGVDINPNERVMNLTRTEQALVAILRAIAKNSNIIVLDEPTACLPAPDVEKLFSVLKKLKDTGVSLVLVSHRLDEIFSVCDDVFVLRDGQAVSECKVSEVNEKELVKLIVGKEIENVKEIITKKTDDPILSIKSVVFGDVGPISFDVYGGEILALCGLRGAGQEEIARILFGVLKHSEGEVLMKGIALNTLTPEQAISKGIGLLAKDRIGESICTTMLVSENIFINPTNHGYSFLYSIKNEFLRAKKKVKDYDIRPQNTNLEISALSGGNQQKAVLARWLDIGTPVLILEDPTQGVDIGARIEIYKYMRTVAKDENVAIIVVSSDFQEIAAIAHRALVFSQGNIEMELMGKDVEVKKLLYYASASNTK